MRRRRLPLRHALALGAIQGPAELVPVSSSGHLVLVPALLGWPCTRLPAEDRKTFEVALHAGTAAALLLLWRRDVLEALRRPAESMLLTAPAAVAGLALERVVEERLSTPPVAAAAQIAGGAALALSQLRLEPAESAQFAGQARTARDSEPVSAQFAGQARKLGGFGLVVGVAQAAALVPGVSRNGATLTAAALAGLGRAEAAAVSRRAAIPIVAGATALKAFRLSRRGLRRELRAPFAAGAGAAFAATLAAAPLGRLPGRHSWLPWAAWRVGLGAIALRRLQALQ